MVQRKFLESLSDEELLTLRYDWPFWAREKQLPPSDLAWFIWLILAGRGWGKTRTGAEWIRDEVENHGAKRVALVARTAADVRDVIIEGESGILAVSTPYFRPKYEPSKRRLTWPNGAIATTYSGDQPDQLRGPQHDRAWGDEVAAWRYPEAFDQLMFGLRLGEPKLILTTTPRPTKIIKDLVKDSQGLGQYSGQRVYLTKGSTLENRANLADTALSQLLTKYAGTRLGRQELEAEILDDNPRALWKRTTIDQYRVVQVPEMMRVIVGVDPAATDDPETSNETGIVIAGLGVDWQGYVLGDYSLIGSPMEWASSAVRAFYEFESNGIVAEKNNGGLMVGTTIATVDPTVPVDLVWASRGKWTRAEPISTLYEQGRVHHVGTFAELEDQMCDWSPDSGKKSPDRMDALVWALTKLMLVGDDMVGDMDEIGQRVSISNY